MLIKKNRTNRSPIGHIFLTVLTFYLAVSSFFPQIRLLPNYQLTVFIALFLLIVYIIVVKTSFLMKPRLAVFFIIYTFLTPYIFNNSTIGNRYLSDGIMFVLYLVYEYNSQFGFQKSNGNIVKWTIPFIIYTSVVTLSNLIRNPTLSRSIKTEGEYTMFLRAQGIGGYEFVYFLMFICIILFFIIMNRKEYELGIFPTLLIGLLLSLFALTVLFSNFFTALAILFIAFGIISFTRKQNLLSKVLNIFAFSFAFFFSRQILIFLIDLLIELLGSGKNVDRLYLLQFELIGNFSGVSLLTDRFSTLELSWTTFLKNSLIGIVVNPIESSGGYLVGFGQHSYFLDTFALFGMLIGSINIIIVLNLFAVRFKSQSSLTGLNLAMLISTMLLFLMNNTTVSIGYAVFFIYPVVYDLLLRKIRA